MAKVKILGFEWDGGSSHSRGPALAPTVVKRLLFSEASSPYSLNLTDIRTAIAGYEIPELPASADGARDVIEATVASSMAGDFTPISIGGDHAVTYPILKAIHAHHGAVNVLHIDAHPDLYEELDGDRFSHACPFRRSLEDGLIGKLVQIGIRCSDPDQAATGRKYGVTMLGAEAMNEIPPEIFDGPLYVSIDLDGLDPAFAPGVSHPEPGGLSTRDVISLIRRINGPLVGADVVELNPERDIQMTTARVVVRLVKELVAKAVGR
jgi:agmatinase